MSAPQNAVCLQGGEAEAEEAKGPALLSVSLTGFKDDSKVKVIKAIKAILAPTDPKFNLAAVSLSELRLTYSFSLPSMPPFECCLREVFSFCFLTYFLCCTACSLGDLPACSLLTTLLARVPRMAGQKICGKPPWRPQGRHLP